MHWLDMTMAAHPNVVQIVYALRHHQDCLAIEGYICLNDAIDKDMAQALLLEFWVRMYD